MAEGDAEDLVEVQVVVDAEAEAKHRTSLRRTLLLRRISQRRMRLMVSSALMQSQTMLRLRMGMSFASSAQSQ